MSKKGHVLGGSSYLTAEGRRFALAMIDLDAPAPGAELVPLSFFPHGVSIDPRDRHRAAVFEKKGPGAGLVDLRTRALLTPITTPSTRRFYGHGVFSADGSLLYATESRLDRDFEGVLVVRDASTLRELGVVPTHGAAPHDCLLLDEGRTMVVANGGGPAGGSVPCVSYIDLPSGKLLDHAPITASEFNAGHLAVSQAGALAVVSAPREGLPSPDTQLGAVSLRTPGGALTTAREPAAVVSRMRGETLSVLIDEASRVALATHPLGDFVSLWRLDDGAFLGTIDVTNPRGLGLSLDRAWVLVSHSTSRTVRLTAYDAVTREPVGFSVEPSFLSGSHLLVHDLSPS